MIPDGGEAPSTASPDKDDVMLAGYRECATEALNWLLGLGYEPGHPLIRSLAAHLTKKQAYLEKLDLERFLVDATFKDSRSENNPEPRYDDCALQIKNNPEVQRALVDAVFKGCDLQYSGAPP